METNWMTEKTKAKPHPDDFLCVSLALDFRAKLNPSADDPPPFNFMGFESTMRASDAADFLQSVLHAIRGRRLYGFLVQQAAESAVGAGEWIEQSPEDTFAEVPATKTKPNRNRLEMLTTKDMDDL
jgi:hypothetical protein